MRRRDVRVAVVLAVMPDLDDVWCWKEDGVRHAWQHPPHMGRWPWLAGWLLPRHMSCASNVYIHHTYLGTDRYDMEYDYEDTGVRTHDEMFVKHAYYHSNTHSLTTLPLAKTTLQPASPPTESKAKRHQDIKKKKNLHFFSSFPYLNISMNRLTWPIRFDPRKTDAC
ncbi:hypothetical protein L249_5830 [Ophiocordyceps polyrhachis-furcata BCC 54312]|uniref:Uncharacterized protein n=1 Tax=Ophiocordyceps polyrhachis-furcata BCC 54312 TaxID=1330021 RepID=A0A367L0T1_9HYPO|nr:hypothetical protein L249_5830 [Ophiocordyceps polyrhachis-furcata BCC 54312]